MSNTTFRRGPWKVATIAGAVLALGVPAVASAASSAIAATSSTESSNPMYAPDTTTTSTVITTASTGVSLSGRATRTRSKGSPVSSSGKDFGLWATGSTVSAQVPATATGGSHVRVVARGTTCQGKQPIVAVAVDGTQVGQLTLTDATNYQVYEAGDAIAAGTHTVSLRLTNDTYVAGSCDLNALISSFTLASTVRDASSTGVPAGLALTRHDGDLYLKTSNVVVSGLDVYGKVFISGSNVVFENSRVHGGSLAGLDQTMKRYSLISSTGRNVVIQDVTAHADETNPNWNGVTGFGFTARRVNVSGTVDTFMTYGNDVTIDRSWTHGNVQYQHDYSWSLKGEPSHTDAWQIEGGSNLKLIGSHLENPEMTAVIMTQNASKIDNVLLDHNTLSGGTCTVNIHNNRATATASAAALGPMTGIVISNNTFGSVATKSFWTTYPGCHVIAQTASAPTLQNNTSTDGYPVVIKRGSN